MMAFGIDTGFVSAWFTEAVVGFGVALPSAPGFFGTFHASASFALSTVYGVDSARALAFAFGYHFGGWIPITLIGPGYAWRLGLSLGEVGAAEERVEAARWRATHRSPRTRESVSVTADGASRSTPREDQPLPAGPGEARRRLPRDRDALPGGRARRPAWW